MDAPVFFLLDEQHDSPQTIAQNVDIAVALFASEGVEIAAVEDYYAKVDFYHGSASAAVNHPISELPNADHVQLPSTFGASVCGAGRLVVGVDSEGWEDEILAAATACYPLLTAGEHYGEVERSKHFLRALLEERAERLFTRNALINCGSAHNGHILSLTKSGDLRPEWWPGVSFVRLRAPAFRDCCKPGRAYTRRV